MPGTEQYGSGTTPTMGDTERVLEVKILTAMNILDALGGGGGGGGTGTVTASAIDPTGVLTITGRGICFGTGAFDGVIWKKTSAGSASDWVQM